MENKLIRTSQKIQLIASLSLVSSATVLQSYRLSIEVQCLVIYLDADASDLQADGAGYALGDEVGLEFHQRNTCDHLKERNSSFNEPTKTNTYESSMGRRKMKTADYNGCGTQLRLDLNKYQVQTNDALVGYRYSPPPLVQFENLNLGTGVVIVRFPLTK